MLDLTLSNARAIQLDAVRNWHVDDEFVWLRPFCLRWTIDYGQAPVDPLSGPQYKWKTAELTSFRCYK